MPSTCRREVGSLSNQVPAGTSSLVRCSCPNGRAGSRLPASSHAEGAKYLLRATSTRRGQKCHQLGLVLRQRQNIHGRLEPRTTESPCLPTKLLHPKLSRPC